ncbi:ABC transporter permease [Anaerotruncus colihominis]|uniref:GNAT family acetyltransferase n=1 Tax=Anaerotruncus colihominis TaxID=169435 RepID=A0A1Y4MSV7_9FIRM|nr:ABC transporter permease [Anaerotruncus colihominis]OUP69962.1 GNAT family acetyltransferase [Anaerotruncus colihominis]OUP74887.1 GNAT family acetyltransferase [Anaerotruncus colihominis]
MKRKSKIDPLAALALCLLGLLLAGSLLAPVLAPYPPTQINMAERLQGISAAHPLGTDTLGRDLLSRVLYGGRVSVLTAAAATALSMLLGLAVGLIAGYLGGWADGVITWFTNIFQGLPSTSVMIALAAILDPGVSSLLLALVLTSWASFSRVVRSSVLRLREEAYVEGARCLGAGRLRIITRYLLPNLLPEIAVLFTTRVGGVVLSVASLSFLGLGIQPPTPDWGVMISEARTSFRTAPMLILAPGACLIILSFGINYLGEMLRAHFDIRGRTRQID